MTFDKVIMNPPYHIGGKIWDEVRKVSEKYHMPNAFNSIQEK